MNRTNKNGASGSVEPIVMIEPKNNLSKRTFRKKSKSVERNAIFQSSVLTSVRGDKCCMPVDSVDNICKSTPGPDYFLPLSGVDITPVKSPKRSGASKIIVKGGPVAKQSRRKCKSSEGSPLNHVFTAAQDGGSSILDCPINDCNRILEPNSVSPRISGMDAPLKEDVPLTSSAKRRNRRAKASEEDGSTKKQTKRKTQLKNCTKNDDNSLSETQDMSGEKSYLEVLSSISDNLIIKMSELRIPSPPDNSIVSKQDQPAGVSRRRRGSSTKQKPVNGQRPVHSYKHNASESRMNEGSHNLSNNVDTPNCKKDGKKHKSKRRSKKWIEEKFEEYMEIDLVTEGLKNKTLIQGEIRINPKNNKHAYISDLDNGKDIIIVGLKDRNRALEGDVVIIKVKEKAQSNGLVHRYGEVVYIKEYVHSRICVGHLRAIDSNFAIFCPNDQRMPVIDVPLCNLPHSILMNPRNDTLYLGRLDKWSEPHHARGIIEKAIGKVGDIEAETEGLLLSLGLDRNPVGEHLSTYLPKIPYEMKEDEIKSRMDLRKMCIFSIDPETARDLDDAVSIEKLGDDEYQVGVHISDVSYFLDLGTPLDKEVSGRSVTIYLIQKVIHMLPIELCLMCSLLPGEDKFAFSVIWKLNSKGEILETEFTRSIINSCCQLSYKHAQAVIEGLDIEFPNIYNGFTKENLKEAILMLHNLAVQLRAQRFTNGALQLDQPKLWFSLDSNYMPTNIGIYELKESNRLIEEFMLMANMSVAAVLLKACPELALLRRHSPPKQNMLEKLEQSLHKLGIFLDISSSKQLHQSVWDNAVDPLILRVLNLLCSKTMNRAEYYCNSDSHHHFALNIPVYTHFTSPIRRYSDIVVHRLLAAHLNYSPLPHWTASEVACFATTCNKKKYAAKRAGDASSELYLALYLRTIGNVEANAVVFNISSHSFDAHILEYAHNIRVYLENLEAKVEYEDNDLASSLIIQWKGSGESILCQVIQVFSEVTLLLKPMPGILNIEAELVAPKDKRHSSLDLIQ